MRIFVKAKPNSKEDKIEEIKTQNKLFENEKIQFDFSFIIKVKAKPVQGGANEAIVKMLSLYFKRPKSSVTLVSGKTSKNKVFEVQTQ